jgi:hypothetical protein
MKAIVFLVLLTTTQYVGSKPLSPVEQDCLARSLYHEGRSLGARDWRRMSNVVLNRAVARRKNRRKVFGARSGNVCDVVRSSEFTTRSRLLSRIREPKIYEKIRQFAKSVKEPTGHELFFSSTRGRMHYK